MTVEMRSVDSTSVAAVGYDEAREELHVRFRSSPAVYIYKHVTASSFEELLTSTSKGRYVNQVIKPNHPVRTDP